MSETIKIYCQNCKEYILDADLDKLGLPFKGWMFKYPDHVEWDTAFEPEATGNDLVCPQCESMFHQEPLILCAIVFPDKTELGWMRVCGMPKEYPKEYYKGMRDQIFDKPPDVDEEIAKRIEKIEKQEVKRGGGKKKKRKRGVSRSKPAIKRNPRETSKSDDPDTADGGEREGSRDPANNPQFNELGSGGVNIDESPGFSD